MILDKDVHPERKIYYLGALILESISESSADNVDMLDIYRELKETYSVSIHMFTLALDWLFLLGAINHINGHIEKCF